MFKLEFEGTVQKQRFWLGVLCGALPILCVLFGVLSCTYGQNPVYILNSISETYYTNHKIIMIGVLLTASGFLFCYEGYDLGDRLWTVLAAIGAAGVAAFPCSSSFHNLDYVGLFSLPNNVSNIVHFIFAFLTFGSLALMTLTQFTKGTDKKRNIIYTVCSIIMLLAIVMIPVSGWIGMPGWSTMLFEFIHLEAFAVAWFTKSKFKVVKS